MRATGPSILPHLDPFEDTTRPFAMGELTTPLDIFDQISQTIYDDDDQEQFQIQPTPIGFHGQVVVVSRLSAQDESDLFDSDEAGDFLDLLSSSSHSERKRHFDYYANPASCHSTDICFSPEPMAKKQKTFSVNVSPASQPREAPSPNWNKWDTRLQELLDFKQTHGHCRVPNVHPENSHLAQWVKRQRYQHKLKVEGKHSTLTEERQRILECIGFVWDAHECTWMERWNELRKFYVEHGHSHVPTNYQKKRQLSIWVKCQRRQYKLYQTGGQSNMTEERVSKMESLKFNWNPRNLK
eukprot:CAMPEP_0117085558 /NCGR_PEP_ID=MMETSP0472-20121206/60130_1 /TAXON_ID=693140 ORGANISM="Tiarina fusus, Strain LIS" /NCGR_SAMPLE_ID=MMETSP0472 /ASSEMBLY_ACC=CAM_ASM_000603 /LENGTH=296 /DNA_ID=CAMNT_0004814831 /DNA_START=55 /DNA_END=945 /DNA_ORIENTATION=-